MTSPLDLGDGSAGVTVTGETGSRVATVVRDGFPTLTLTESVVGLETTFTAELGGVDGLNPLRTLNSEELGAGLVSLAPPIAVTANGPVAIAELSGLVLSTAIAATRDLDAVADIMIRYKTACVVNAALRAMGYAA
jgi:hypothetical protein